MGYGGVAVAGRFRYPQTKFFLEKTAYCLTPCLPETLLVQLLVVGIARNIEVSVEARIVDRHARHFNLPLGRFKWPRAEPAVGLGIIHLVAPRAA
jgi:hypothetical protein